MSNSQLPLASRVAGRVSRQLRTHSINRALRRRGLGRAHEIHTFTTRDELEALYYLANACRTDGRAFEVGSYLGGIDMLHRSGLGGECCSVTCIDTWRNETMPGGIRDTLAEFKANTRSVRAYPRLLPKRSRDVDQAELTGPFDVQGSPGEEFTCIGGARTSAQQFYHQRIA
jgi:hypothetical protein